MGRGGRAPAPLGALLVALSPALRCGAEIVVQDAGALEQKFDLSWAQKKLNEARAQAGGVYQKAIDASAQATNATAGAIGNLKAQAEHATGALGNVTGVLMGNLGAEGKRKALWALMTYLGKCPEFYASLPKVPSVTAPFLADALQEASDEPSIGETSCNQAVQQGVAGAVDRYVSGANDQEKVAIRWIANDRAHIVCNPSLMASLELFAPIRKDYPAQYTEAVKDKLIMDVLSAGLLTAELDKICGGRKDVRLFSLGRHKPRRRSLLRGLAAPAPWLAAGCLVPFTFLAGFAWRRARQRHGGRALPLVAPEVQDGPLMSVEAE